MFVKLKTLEEERDCIIEEATAIVTEKENVQAILTSVSKFKIPEHLKRVKKDNKEILVLYSLGKMEIPNGLTVMVPRFKAHTKSQYNEARNYWPCNYFQIYDENIDQQLCKKNMETLLNYYNKDMDDHYCSGICMIYDEDSLISVGEDTEYIFGHGIIKCISNISSSKRGYLCTGYTAFIYREPCYSCAMAMVHGRIKRVFCNNAGTKVSPFIGNKFNYNENLNHRYNVYFPEENLSLE